MSRIYTGAIQVPTISTSSADLIRGLIDHGSCVTVIARECDLGAIETIGRDAKTKPHVILLKGVKKDGAPDTLHGFNIFSGLRKDAISHLMLQATGDKDPSNIFPVRRANFIDLVVEIMAWKNGTGGSYSAFIEFSKIDFLLTLLHDGDDLPVEIEDRLRKYFLSIPGYVDSLKTRQSGTVIGQHGFLASMAISGLSDLTHLGNGPFSYYNAIRSRESVFFVLPYDGQHSSEDDGDIDLLLNVIRWTYQSVSQDIATDPGLSLPSQVVAVPALRGGVDPDLVRSLHGLGVSVLL